LPCAREKPPRLAQPDPRHRLAHRSGLAQGRPPHLAFRRGHHRGLRVELRLRQRRGPGIQLLSLALGTRHRIHGYLGGIWGDAPYFDRFFVGDLNSLLPPRALGLNFSTQPSHDLLGTGIAAHRYDNLAGRALVEYAIPIWSRHGLLYRGDAFAAFGVFALSNPTISRIATCPCRGPSPDLTADLGIRLDTPSASSRSRWPTPSAGSLSDDSAGRA
jgi:hypothetical protein